MPKRISSAQFITILIANGFAFVSQRGSHANYRDTLGRTVIIPHSRKDNPVGTLRP